MIGKREFNKLRKAMNEGARRPLSDIKLNEMLESYFCDDPDEKVALSRMGLTQIVVQKFRKQMASMGYKEAVKLQGGNGKSQAIKFSVENMAYYAQNQNMIIQSGHYI